MNLLPWLLGVHVTIIHVLLLGYVLYDLAKSGFGSGWAIFSTMYLLIWVGVWIGKYAWVRTSSSQKKS